MKKKEGKRMKLLTKPLVLSLASTGLWFLLRFIGLGDFIQGDEGGAMPSGTIAFLGVIYALLAAFTTANVWSQWVVVEEAVKTGDHQKFILNKDKRMPGTLKLLLLMFSIFLVVGFYLLYFKNPLPGGFSIFAVTMAVSAVWVVIMDLDDPFSGIWNVQVPEKWRKEE